jgi:hypothetical protein
LEKAGLLMNGVEEGVIDSPYFTDIIDFSMLRGGE